MTTALDLKPGDLYPHPLDADLPPCHVDHIVVTDKRKFGTTDIPIVQVHLSDGPKVIKWIDTPGDRVVTA
jgi:hypothetical protein